MYFCCFSQCFLLNSYCFCGLFCVWFLSGFNWSWFWIPSCDFDEIYSLIVTIWCRFYVFGLLFLLGFIGFFHIKGKGILFTLLFFFGGVQKLYFYSLQLIWVVLRLWLRSIYSSMMTLWDDMNVYSLVQ